MKLPNKHDRWRFGRVFWMGVGLVLGVWMIVVVLGWVIRFLFGAR